MPEISRFLGIVIFMNFNEHPPPHFHARYVNYHITVEINTGIVEGKFPKRALRLVLEWYEMHKDELLENWNSMRETGEFFKISPLE
jgi:hypothetical protein